jgi:hypothetical protein
VLDGERIVRRREEEVNEILCSGLCMSSEMLKTFSKIFCRKKNGRSVLRPYKKLLVIFYAARFLEARDQM